MSDQKKKKRVKIGTIKEGEFGLYLQLGEQKSKDPKYNFTTKVRVEQEGKEAVTVSNKNLSVVDPRKLNPDRNVPKFVKYEVYLTLSEE